MQTLINRLTLGLTLATFSLSIFVSVIDDASAESRTRVRKSTTTVTTSETEGDEEEVATEPTPSSAAEKDFIVTATFGSKATTGTAGCKTEALSAQVIRDLKSDCGAWVKDRKAELKSKFQTSTCEEQCNDCGMSLQRCTVTGVVHYSK